LIFEKFQIKYKNIQKQTHEKSSAKFANHPQFGKKIK